MDEFVVRRRRRPPKPRWPYYLIGALALVIVLVLVGFAAVRLMNRYEVQISVYGDREVTLEIGTGFADPGATGHWRGTLLDKDWTQTEIEVESDLNLEKLGTYTITYSAEHKGVTDSETRVIHIVDTQAPEITLVADPETYTLPNQEYEEEGFTAVDNYDGDITDRVERRVEGDMVIYSVTDSSGNSAEARREIVRLDPELPRLTLKGDSKITIIAGNKWSEPGYTAADNVDGDLTAKVKVSGSVDGYIAGTYKLTYEVTDSFGNTATATRTVTVEPVKQPEVAEPNGKVIYLTFDDGPREYTDELLAILEKYNVKVTFFVCRTGRLDLLDDIAKGGHSIGIHSLTHRYEQIYASEEAFFSDLYAMRDLVTQYTGIETTLLRFPGGSSNTISRNYCPGIMTQLTKAVESQGFQYFDWNVDSDDAGNTTTAAGVAQNVIKGVQNRKYSVVLMHDTYEYTIQAVEQIIVWGLSNGYTFQALESTSPVCHHGVNN